MNLDSALQAAARLHQCQVDKGGEPYILHPIRVALSLRDPRERIVALLHDTVEDCGWERLRAETCCMPDWLLEALDAITRRPGEAYESTYLDRVAANPLARAVKLADLADNLDRARIPNPGPRDLARWERYERAVARLRG